MTMASPGALQDNGRLVPLGLDENSTVLIVGLGKTGLSVARFLCGRGIRFAVNDTREKPPSLKDFREQFPDAAVFLGGFEASAFAAASHLIVSPGVSLQEPLIQSAKRRGIPVLGDLDLFASMARAPVIGITGSNGKSTVTTLVGLMGEADGRKTRVGGNLGTPMLELLDDDAELYVLELSSFQLESSHWLEPLAATVLNISPDHMDRYPDIDAYANAKARIFQGQGLMVLNRDDAMVARMARDGRPIAWFSLLDSEADYRLGWVENVEWLLSPGGPLMPRDEVKLQGRHNLANALAAMALADGADISRSTQRSVLNKFTGLDHRMEWVGEFSGVDWINDSKATNVGACMAALAGLDKPVILIAGGDGKGADFSLLRSVVRDKVKALILMGKDAPALKSALGDLVSTVLVENMRQAVESAHRLASSGDVVLLAPACASLDQYKDYQHRGQMFTDEVRKLAR